MSWVVLVVRIIVGLPLVAGGVAYFLKVVPEPPELPEHAKTFGGVLAATGYMDVVKALEIAGDLCIYTNRSIEVEEL